MATRAKSQQDKFLEELQAAGTPDYWQRSEVRAALRAQQLPLPPETPKSDATNPVSGDEAGPASLDANGINAVSARDATGTVGTTETDIPPEDDLDALTRSTLQLQEATRQRRAADRLKTQYPNTDQAQQQATADEIQQALGTARRVSMATQGGIRDRVFAAADRLGAVSTPGGIVALLLILALLLFVLVEVNGQPRGVWLWLVLLRKAHLRPREDAAARDEEAAKGRREPISEATTGQQEPLTASAASAASVSSVPAGASNVTPINVFSGMTALDRYVNS